MTEKAARQGMFWGAFLIVLAVLLILNQFTEVIGWVWFGLLALSGLGALGLYVAERSDWAMLLAGYVLLAIALLIALTTLDILRDEAVAGYVLLAIALPFLAVYYRDRAQWWALIPAYVLLAVGVMVGLLGLGFLSDLMVPAYVLFAVAIPFFVVYALDRRNWWALIPGGIMALVGLFFLMAEAALAYVGALVLILAGAWILVRAFTRREPSAEVVPAAPEPEMVAGQDQSEERASHTE